MNSKRFGRRPLSVCKDASLTNDKSPRMAFCVIACLVSYACSLACARYLKAEPEPLFRLVLFTVGVVSSKVLISRFSKLRPVEMVVWVLFSFVFSLSIVLGYHIVTTGSYGGGINDTYVAPYGWADLLALIAITFFMATVLNALYVLLKTSVKDRAFRFDNVAGQVEPKEVLAGAALLFVLYLPYLLIYYPGFVFGDSLSSLKQIASGVYSNHHPFAYTMLIGGFVRTAELFGGGMTEGIVAYCVFQMAVMAATLSYMISWVSTRCGLSAWWRACLLLAFGATSYIATYTVALWKDPLFSCAIVIVSILLADWVLADAHPITKKRAIAIGMALLVSGLLRSNGIVASAIVALCCLGMLIAALVRKDALAIRSSRMLFAVSTAAIVGVLAITGPLYTALGVKPAERVESLAVPLAQVSRVASLGGDMSERDKSYMDKMLPIEEYASVCNPLTIDKLKWHEDFDGAALSEGEFATRWASMLFRNPRIYLEAWELQTYGFWAVNAPSIGVAVGNIAGGVPRNTVMEYSSQLDELNIRYGNLLGNDEVRAIFKQDEWSIPVAWITWLIAWITTCLILMRRIRFTLALAPSAGVALSLIVASPIWYWPRYGLPEQLLLPFFVSILYLACMGSGQFREDGA